MPSRPQVTAGALPRIAGNSPGPGPRGQVSRASHSPPRAPGGSTNDSRTNRLIHKLEQLVHLAERDRRLAEAQRRVRMAQDSAEASGQGSEQPQTDTTSTAAEESTPDLGVLSREVLEELIRQLQARLDRRPEAPDAHGNRW